MAEVWRVIPSAPDYEVSSLGRVRTPAGSDRLPAGALLKLTPAHGYRVVRMRVDGVTRQAFVHRLVCEAFHGPSPSPKHQAAHWDGDRANNAVSNLRWATSTENNADKWRHGRAAFGAAVNGAVLNDETVQEIRRRYAAGCSQSKIAAAFGTTQTNVSFICTGKTWRHV